MKRRLIWMVAVLSLVALGIVGVAAVAVAAEWPTVKPMMTVTTDGTSATFVIMVQNNSTDRLLFEDVRGALHGNRLLTSWAGNPEAHRAKNYGDAVGWINKANIAAGKAQGPFVYRVDLSGQGAVSHGWLWFKTEKVTAEVSTDLIMP